MMKAERSFPVDTAATRAPRHRWASSPLGLAVTALALAVLVGTAGCKKQTLTENECEEMSTHIGDVLTPNEEPAMRTARHAARRSSTGHDLKIAECQRDARRADYECIMAAKTSDDLKTCDAK